MEQAQVQLKVIAHTDSLFVSWQLPRTDLLITGYRLYYRRVCPTPDPAASCPWQGKNDWDRGPIKLKKKRKQYEITDLSELACLGLWATKVIWGGMWAICLGPVQRKVPFTGLKGWIHQAAI